MARGRTQVWLVRLMVDGIPQEREMRIEPEAPLALACAESRAIRREIEDGADQVYAMHSHFVREEG